MQIQSRGIQTKNSKGKDPKHWEEQVYMLEEQAKPRSMQLDEWDAEHVNSGVPVNNPQTVPQNKKTKTKQDKSPHW